MADPKTNPLDRLDPELSLRPGTFDANAVLALWCVRKSFFPTFWLGLSVAYIALGDPDRISSELDLTSPKAMFSALLSPLGVIVAAFGIRIISNWVALAAAFPLTLTTRRHHYESGNRVSRGFHLLWDRLYMARAYRSLRQTWGVRERAHSRLAPNDRFYTLLELALRWANIVLLIAMFVVLGAVTENAAG